MWESRWILQRIGLWQAISLLLLLLKRRIYSQVRRRRPGLSLPLLSAPAHAVPVTLLLLLLLRWCGRHDGYSIRHWICHLVLPFICRKTPQRQSCNIRERELQQQERRTEKGDSSEESTTFFKLWCHRSSPCIFPFTQPSSSQNGVVVVVFVQGDCFPQ